MSEWFEHYGFGEVADGLLTGAVPADAEDVAALRAAGVTRVLNLCQDSEYVDGDREAVEAAYLAAGIAEERLPTQDFGGLMPGLLERAARTTGGWLDEGQTVYLHCRAGWQRSATAAAAALAVREDLAPDEALAAIRRRRPACEPLAHQLEDLWRWHRARAARDAG